MQNETFLNEILNNPKVDINIQNKQMNTPLHLAIEENNELLAMLLIKNDKCNLSLTNNEEMTPLMLAFDKSQEEIVNLILSIPRNININMKDNRGILLIIRFFTWQSFIMQQKVIITNFSFHY